MRRGTPSAGVRVTLLGLAAAALVLLAAGCGDDDTEPGAGLHLSGQVDGRTVSVSQPQPVLLEGDCEARAGLPAAVCFAATATGGTPLTVGLANLDQVSVGEPTEVVAPGCSSASSCARIDEGAVVLLSLDEELVRPREGVLTLRQATAGERYVGELRLELPGGRLTGGFDVAPRPDPQPPGGAGSPADDGPPAEDGRQRDRGEDPGPGEAFTPDEVEPADPDDLDD